VQTPPEEATPRALPTPQLPGAPGPVAVAAAPESQPPLAHALVAEADAAIAKGVAEFLAGRRISSERVENGSQALLRIYRKRPDLVVLGGHLPDVSASVIAELLRRTAELRDLPSIRIAPQSEPVGPPEVEASATLEPGDLPTGLGPILDRFGIGQKAEAPRPPALTATRPQAVAPAATPARPAPAPVRPAPAPLPKAAPAAAASSDPEIAKAERLARITVSDIILYNERKFAAAVNSGKIAEALAHELAEARQHFDSRVPAEVRGSRDFLVEELQRRAAQYRG
jgi:CheY-like chemotaxis protein